MAHYVSENVHTNSFTPREFLVDLLETTKIQNTIIFSNTSSAKGFLSLKIVQQFARDIRNGSKKGLFIMSPENIAVLKLQLKLLTNLNVWGESEGCEENPDLSNESVVILSADTCLDYLDKRIIKIDYFRLIVVDDGLYKDDENKVRQILENRVLNEVRIVGLVSGLLTDDMQPAHLEAQMNRLEKLLGATFASSSELVTLLRLNYKPTEYIVEFPSTIATPLEDLIKLKVGEARGFLEEHVFDPSITYSGDLLQEFLSLPHPAKMPLDIIKDFEDILEQLGVWGAEKAALNFITVLEKLKVTESFDRHYLLLCMLQTLMVQICAICVHEFEDLELTEIYEQFASSKVKRLVEIIKSFKPEGPKPVVVQEVQKPLENSPPSQSPKHTQTNKRKGQKGPRKNFHQRNQQDDMLCSIVYVENRSTAKILRDIIQTMSVIDDDLWWVGCLYCVDKIIDPIKQPKEAESEHRRQEDVLRKFRAHECNILVTTSVLEQGCDLPKCNLVLRFDQPDTFNSYIQSKSKARVPESHYVILTKDSEVKPFVGKLAEFMEVEKILLNRCNYLEPCENDKQKADLLSLKYSPYKTDENGIALTLETAISIINKYCAKLPSDTFTKLTPIWETRALENGGKFVCKLRLPINSPVKHFLESECYESQLLAKRAAAFSMCTMLHSAGELDNNWQPISKENFRAADEDWNNCALESDDEDQSKENPEQRPGTTKRRQYYYKKVADVLLNCQPEPGKPTYFYKIVLKLTCPLPEEQNTRGRKIYPPEDSIQGFGILTSKRIPQICSFPIFTRSGEVNVSLELCASDIILPEEKISVIIDFLNYTFTSVLRLQKFLMHFGVENSESSYFIVPTIADGNSTEIDWDFLQLIYENKNVKPEHIPNEDRVNFAFDAAKYRDAVIMPWYRNQDQPQYFYVAEICSHLNPLSMFPGSEYKTFDDYYFRKYNIQIQNKEQLLLDVDHTSARLNFLTPRYVNRKGVALPTSSEETKKAKRENLEQKQILVPELCTIHPFPASLWRKAVCLPCILYRINALLLADQIRQTVALEMGLGQINLPSDFKWSELNFGWNLSDVLKRKEPKLIEVETKLKVEELKEASSVKIKELDVDDNDEEANEKKGDVEGEDKGENDVEQEEEEGKEWVEIGTWSNDMVDNSLYEQGSVRYGSPTNWLTNTYDDDYSTDCDDSFSTTSVSDSGGMHIEFGADNIAEAMDYDHCLDDSSHLVCSQDTWYSKDSNIENDSYAKFIEENKTKIYAKGVVIPANKAFIRATNREINQTDIRESSGMLTPPIQQYTSMYKETAFKDKLKIIEDDLEFSFDRQPNLNEHPGPSPSVILQALTMSNANDGINLERLETIGDSFLKYAITDFLYSKYENVHEGKLSHLRSKQVSNLNLYRLGKKKGFGGSMIATKFDPHDNWLPPCYYVPKQLEEALMDGRVPYWEMASTCDGENLTVDEWCEKIKEYRRTFLEFPSSIPYNLVTQHSIPDKSIADCVEALIGAYLIECGPRGGLLFMAWLGIKVLPQNDDGYGELPIPRSPLVRHIDDPESYLEVLLDGFENFEQTLGYTFRDRAYLLQALSHASYSPNILTDCYQRLEFLGDAVLDYLITRHLYEDKRMHSPGALTDLRSALVNNTIFASLAVRYGFHKYFLHLSPGLHEVVERFIRLQEQCGHALVDELYLVAGNACEEVEDVEVPKALGDIFESVAGAIYLDSGRSLDAVWKVYFHMMRKEIEQFSDKVPKSPIRELLELEPETAKFGTPEKLADGRRVRVTVEVFGKGTFKGIGRNYRIAKCTAAKCALKYLKRQGLVRRNIN